MADATFRAGGLVSGLDTNFLVEELTKLQRIPLDRLKVRKTAYTRQVSALGDIASRLAKFKTAAANLATGGALGVKASSTHTSFSVTPGTSAAAGQYDVEVTKLATNARALSAGVATGATMKEGTLSLGVDGTQYAVNIAQGASLQNVADAIKASGAAVSAVVLNNGTSDYLSVVRKDSGYTVGSSAADALTLSANYTGLSGQELTFAVTAPENAKVSVNGLEFTRTTNTISDAVPGATLTLKEAGKPVETLQLENDSTKTGENLKAFVDAYNEVMKSLTDNLRPAANTDRQQTLSGDGALRSLQRSLQNVVTSNVGGLSNVRNLADLGFKTSAVDGSLTLDQAALTKALARDSEALNSIFSTASTGVSAVVADVASRYTNADDGILVTRQKGIKAQVRGLDSQADSMEVRIASFRNTLINQFTAMEKTMAGLRATGSFLNSR